MHNKPNIQIALPQIPTRRDFQANVYAFSAHSWFLGTKSLRMDNPDCSLAKHRDGTSMPGYSFKHDSTDGYRYGFNNQEKESELGDYYSFEYRFLNPNIGRWFSVDPKTKKYPEFGGYCAFINNPLVFKDPDGGAIFPSITFQKSKCYPVFSSLITTINKNQNPENKVTSVFLTFYSDCGTTIYDLELDYGCENHKKQTMPTNVGGVTMPNPLHKMQSVIMNHNAVAGNTERNEADYHELYLYVQTDLYIAINMIHELIHAKLETDGINGAHQNHHNIIANEYFNDIVNFTLIWALDNGIQGEPGKDLKTQIEAMVLAGLSKTDKYKEMFGYQDETGSWIRTAEQQNNANKYMPFMNVDKSPMSYQRILCMDDIKDMNQNNATDNYPQNAYLGNPLIINPSPQKSPYQWYDIENKTK